VIGVTKKKTGGGENEDGEQRRKARVLGYDNRLVGKIFPQTPKEDPMKTKKPTPEAKFGAATTGGKKNFQRKKEIGRQTKRPTGGELKDGLKRPIGEGGVRGSRDSGEDWGPNRKGSRMQAQWVVHLWRLKRSGVCGQRQKRPVRAKRKGLSRKTTLKLMLN